MESTLQTNVLGRMRADAHSRHGFHVAAMLLDFSTTERSVETLSRTRSPSLEALCLATNFLGKQASKQAVAKTSTERPFAFPLMLPYFATTACSSSRADIVQRQSEPLSSLGANTLIADGNETAAAAFDAIDPVGGNPITNLIVGFNPITGHDTARWGVSSNRGLSWAVHDTAGPMLYTFPSIAPSYPPATFHSWYADTNVAGVGIRNDVVFVSAVISNKNTSDVGLALSVDGGNTFASAIRVNNPENGANTIDSPKVAGNGVGSAWVWWYSAPAGLAGSGNYLRRIAISGSTLTPDSQIDLTGVLRVPTAQHAALAVRHDAVGDTIYLVYSNVGAGPADCTQPPPAGAQGQTVHAIWYLSVMSPSQTWTHYTMADDPEWPQCLTNQYNGQNRWIPEIAYDSTSQRLVTVINQSQRDSANNKVGTRAMVRQFPNALGQNAFDLWIPVCNPQICPNPTAQPCLIEGRLPVGESFCNQYGVEIAATSIGGGASRAAVAWHDTRDSISPMPPPPGPSPPVLNLQASIWGASFRPGTPKDHAPQTQSRISSGAGVPWTQTGTVGNTAWGDYEGMCAENGLFHGFWGDDRSGSTTPQVYTASFGP